MLKEISIVEIFEKLQDFTKLKSHYLGDVFETAFENAFDLSAITGCCYLITPEGISIKGRNETFIHRSVFQQGSYIYSPGLFGRDLNLFIKPLNTLEIIEKKYPSIFTGKKKIIIKVLEKNQLSNVESVIYNKIISQSEDPKDYMVLKLKNTSGLEPFLEYLIYKYFQKEGYFFENQVPFFQQNFLYKGKKNSGGIPDVSIFKLECIESFEKRNLCSSNYGLCLNRIPYLKKFKSNDITKTNSKEKKKYELLLGEVKGSVKSIEQAQKQLKKYSFVDLADYAFSCTPEIFKNTENYGHIYFKNNQLCKDFSAINYYKNLNDTFRKTDNEFMETMIKINLLGNLNFSILKEIVNKYLGLKTEFFKSYDLIKFCLDHSIEEIFDLVEL
ncbi:hypothetical protein N9V56_04125 [Alphaproteobacteria bacterium]|nr:hypothetical protein [Alphaproteobacteria bacterium]